VTLPARRHLLNGGRLCSEHPLARKVSMTVTSLLRFLVEYAASTQSVFYLAVMISMWSAEKMLLGGDLDAKMRHSAGNALFILSALPIQLCMMHFCLSLANWAVARRWGLLFQLPGADGPLIRLGVSFVLLDFLDYVYHVAMHQVPAFWRFHLLHHTDRSLDVSTTVREHPGETFLRNAFLMLWVGLCGASVEALVLRQTVETVANILAHTAFRLPPAPARWLGWLLITPNSHHVHHHFQLPATNCNYGDVFSLWDRIFGTWTEMESDELVFGLDTHMADAK
jgi:sterol desaturase/sphingolipid hydroxylase (fatty acid hydroxylase superfamily)